jgi:hypothetical protein
MRPSFARLLPPLLLLPLFACSVNHPFPDRPLDEREIRESNSHGGSALLTYRDGSRDTAVRARVSSDSVRFQRRMRPDSTVALAELERLERRDGSRGFGAGFGIGFLVGGTLGMIAGYASGDSPDEQVMCFGCDGEIRPGMKAGTKAKVGLVFGGLAGGLLGGIIGSVVGAPENYSRGLPAPPPGFDTTATDPHRIAPEPSHR